MCLMAKVFHENLAKDEKCVLFKLLMMFDCLNFQGNSIPHNSMIQGHDAQFWANPCPTPCIWNSRGGGKSLQGKCCEKV